MVTQLAHRLVGTWLLHGGLEALNKRWLPTTLWLQHQILLRVYKGNLLLIAAIIGHKPKLGLLGGVTGTLRVVVIIEFLTLGLEIVLKLHLCQYLIMVLSMLILLVIILQLSTICNKLLAKLSIAIALLLLSIKSI